jgi:hypothetical protein
MNCGLAGLIFSAALIALIFFGVLNPKPLVICGLIMFLTGDYWVSNSCKFEDTQDGADDYCSIYRCR